MNDARSKAIAAEVEELWMVLGAVAETLGMPEGTLVEDVIAVLRDELPADLLKLTPASVLRALRRHQGRC